MLRLTCTILTLSVFLIGCTSTPPRTPAPILDRSAPTYGPAIDPDTGDEQPLMELPKVVISLTSQELAVIEDNAVTLRVPISSGKRGHPTPTGKFSVDTKDIDHVSSSYPKPHGGAPMPYAVRISGPYWIHAGHLPGHPDSHGCVRLDVSNAERVYHSVDIGDSIVISEQVLKNWLHQRGLASP